MHSDSFFLSAFIYLTAAVISVPIAKRLGLGSVLGYLLAGIVIGPFGFQLVGTEGQDVLHFAEFGVVMMLFLIGLELQPSLLWKMRVPILGLGGLQVALTGLFISLIALYLGLPWQSALSIGMILALSSTAIVLQTLNEKGLLKTTGGQSAFSVLLFQDIAVIPMLAILPLLAVEISSFSGGENQGTWIQTLPVYLQTLVVFSAMAVIVVGGRYITRPVFRFIAQIRSREIFTAAALLLVVGITLLMEIVGLSPALGTFMAGVVLASNEYRHELESDIEPFKGLLLGLFFISVGASIDFELISSQPGLIMLLVIGLMTLKFFVLIILGRYFKLTTDNNMMFAFSLAQSGEFGFVLFSFAAQNGVLDAEITATLIAVVAMSMALTPLAMLVNEKLIQPRLGTKTQDEREADLIDEENPVIIAGFGRFGNILGRLLIANGIKITILDIDADNVEMLRKLGIKVFYGDASRLDLLTAAGAGKAKILILAIDEPDKIIEIVHTVRKHFPGLKIYARANGRFDAYELIEMGIDHVYRETFDTSIKAGVDVLRDLGFHAYQAHRTSRIFRRRDENDLRELSLMRHDRQTYISTARQKIKDLENILLKEWEEIEDFRDAGWDSVPLREEVKKMSKK